MSGNHDDVCKCGEPFEVAVVDLGLGLRCRACASEATQSRSFDLLKGQIPPDLTPYRDAARKQISSSETMEVLLPDPGSVGQDTSALRMSLPPGGRTTAVTPDLDGAGEQPELPPGTELGCFRLLETLGQGGMGVVYKAHDTSLDRHVALKVLSPALTRNSSFTERFRREAVACGKLSHPNITHIYSISRKDEAFHYFAMEYVEGQNLAERVRDDGPFPVDKALEIVRQCSLGLKEAAAAKIIHRDIKPSNLLLTPGGQVKITDFGLAKAKAAMGHTLDLTSTGVVMGTPLYMSPEQGRGGTVDHRSDIYSLGATLFFLIFGCPPFEADSPIALILKHINDPITFPAEREIPAGVRELLLRMMQKPLSRRVGTYDELLEMLEAIRRGETLGEESSRRVIVLNAVGRAATARKARKSGIFSTSGLKATKLSVARTNIKLGRRGKAVSLLQETIREGDPGLRAEAALLLLSLYEKEDDQEGVREMAEVVLKDPPNTEAAAYAAWKLACLAERDAVVATRQAISRYEAILGELPPELPRDVVEAQVRRLKAQVSEAERDLSSTQIILRTKS